MASLKQATTPAGKPEALTDDALAHVRGGASGVPGFSVAGGGGGAVGEASVPSLSEIVVTKDLDSTSPLWGSAAARSIRAGGSVLLTFKILPRRDNFPQAIDFVGAHDGRVPLRRHPGEGRT